jgi:hypothetical protein
MENQNKLQNYKETTIGIITEAKILEPEDLQVIESLKEELKDVFLTSQIFRTRTEMEISVLNEVSFPTPDAKYWQAVREQNVMFQELVLLSYEYRKNIIEIKKLKRAFYSEKDELEQELLGVEIERREFISKNQERTAKDRIREINQWHEIKQGLIPQLKFGVTDVDKHQLESYHERYVREKEIVGNTGSLPEKINLVSLLNSAKKKIKEHKSLKE